MNDKLFFAQMLNIKLSDKQKAYLKGEDIIWYRRNGQTFVKMFELFYNLEFSDGKTFCFKTENVIHIFKLNFFDLLESIGYKQYIRNGSIINKVFYRDKLVIFCNLNTPADTTRGYKFDEIIVDDYA